MITIVSGIPRSGTSLMMQMLSAGGLPLLTDDLRLPDQSNPRGYCEWAPVKSLARAPEVIDTAEGKVVKVVSWLLPVLPTQHQYRVIFMCRPLEEIVASQDKMLERMGKTAPDKPKESFIDFQKHLNHIRGWLAKQPNIEVLYVEYASILANPQQIANTVSAFLKKKLDVENMSHQVDESLYRERSL